MCPVHWKRTTFWDLPQALVDIAMANVMVTALGLQHQTSLGLDLSLCSPRLHDLG